MDGNFNFSFFVQIPVDLRSYSLFFERFDERGTNVHDVVHVFPLFFLTRSSERERERGMKSRGARAPEIQGSSNKLEPWTERKARRARFHARLPFLYLPRLHIRACRNNRQPLLRFKGIILQTFSSLSFSLHAELASE